MEHATFFKNETQRMLFELMGSPKSRHYKADLAKAIKDLRGDAKDDDQKAAKSKPKKGLKATTAEKKKRKSRGSKGRGKGGKGKGKKRKAGEDAEDDGDDDDEDEPNEDWVAWQLVLTFYNQWQSVETVTQFHVIDWLLTLITFISLFFRTIDSIPMEIAFLRMMGRTMLDWKTTRKKIQCECQGWKLQPPNTVSHSNVKGIINTNKLIQKQDFHMGPHKSSSTP